MNHAPINRAPTHPDSIDALAHTLLRVNPPGTAAEVTVTITRQRWARATAEGILRELYDRHGLTLQHTHQVIDPGAPARAVHRRPDEPTTEYPLGPGVEDPATRRVDPHDARAFNPGIVFKPTPKPANTPRTTDAAGVNESPAEVGQHTGSTQVDSQALAAATHDAVLASFQSVTELFASVLKFERQRAQRDAQRLGEMERTARAVADSTRKKAGR